jgi:extracellular factor (EF) 3-hydroxypalmitic acid methyl ester biosynthesis protein
MLHARGLPGPTEDHDASVPTDAAEAFITTLYAIDRRARHDRRTLPTDAERQAALTTFWGTIDALAAYEAVAMPDDLAAAGRRVRAIVRPWLLRSRHWNRSDLKPHGYAGDFRMLEWMYDLEQDGCADPTQPAVVNVLDGLYASVHSVQAVWHRRRWFAGLVRREQRARDAVRVLDVACGGSRYLRDLMTGPRAAAGVEAVFVDQDPAAIAFVESWLPDGASATVCAPARRVREAVADHVGDGFDVVLSTGLFDYLAAADAEALLGDMVALTRPGGVVAICNFCPADGSRLVKDWISDWRLIYRTEHDLSALFPRPGAVALERSPDGGLVYASTWRES